jgi:hypothetical protein
MVIFPIRGISDPELSCSSQPTTLRRSTSPPEFHLQLSPPAKNTAQLTTLFALSNLWMARRALLATGDVRP